MSRELKGLADFLKAEVKEEASDLMQVVHDLQAQGGGEVRIETETVIVSQVQKQAASSKRKAPHSTDGGTRKTAAASKRKKKPVVSEQPISKPRKRMEVGLAAAEAADNAVEAGDVVAAIAVAEPAVEKPKTKPRKRAAKAAVEAVAAAADDAVAGAPIAEQLAEKPPAAAVAKPSAKNRKAAQARVARERAAHFARADRDDAREQGSSKKPETPQGDEWCGPFATARRLLQERAAAAAARKERIEGGVAEAGDDDSDSEDSDGAEKAPAVKKVVVEWEGKGQGSLIGRAFTVPPLFQLCLQMLVTNFEHVEDLGDVTAEVRNRLAALLCRQLKLNSSVLERIAGPGVTEVVLPDCSRIDAEEMLATLFRCRSTLSVLDLRMCGRCFDDDTAAALTSAGGFPALTRLGLSGLYRLSEPALDSLLAACPKLRALELPQYSRLTGAGVESIVRRCGSSLVGLSLGLCQQLSAEALGKLTTFTQLRALDLSGMPALTDTLLAGVLQRCGGKLQALSISDCEALTGEGTAAAIGSFCGGSLATLDFGCNPGITSNAAALTVLFEDAASARDSGYSTSSSTIATAAEATVSLDGGGSSSGSVSGGGGGSSSSSAAGGSSSGGGGSSGGSSANSASVRTKGHPCAELHTLCIRNLRAVDGRGGDEAMVAMARACAGTLRNLDLCGSDVSDATLVALAQHCSSSLVKLDLSFCRSITNQGLGHLVDRCHRLESLQLWGNIHINDEFLKKHTQEALHVIKV